MGDVDAVRQTVLVNGKSVILAGDLHLAGGEVLDGVIGAVMAEFIFSVVAPSAKASI